MPTVRDQVIHLARERGVLDAKALEEQGIARQHLSRLYREGVLDRVERGLYVLKESEGSEHQTLIEAARRVPHGVVCLLSALSFHHLTTQAPFEVWLAIENGARRPAVERLPIRVVYMSGEAFASSIETHEIDGIAVRVYAPAKTVADCFKFRNKVGLDVAIEALRDYRRRSDFSMDELWRAAKIDRVNNVMRPYLESVA
jgi:predicted transcriptional regulator of viral defense system